MTLAVALWVRSVLGTRYGEAIPFNLVESFEDSAPAVPVFFLLSAGVAVPMDELTKLGRQFGATEEAGKFVVVSLGQGQEPVAEKALDLMYANVSTSAGLGGGFSNLGTVSHHITTPCALCPVPCASALAHRDRAEGAIEDFAAVPATRRSPDRLSSQRPRLPLLWIRAAGC